MATPSGDGVRPVTALFADIVGSTGLGERLALARGQGRRRRVRESHDAGGRAVRRHRPVVHGRRDRRVLRCPVRARGRPGARLPGCAPDHRCRRRVRRRGRGRLGHLGLQRPRRDQHRRDRRRAGRRRRPAVGHARRHRERRARLQSAAEPGTIAVGEATAKAVVHRFVLEPLGEISVKGRIKAVEAWRLVCPQTEAQAAPQTPLSVAPPRSSGSARSSASSRPGADSCCS